MQQLILDAVKYTFGLTSVDFVSWRRLGSDILICLRQVVVKGGKFWLDKFAI